MTCLTSGGESCMRPPPWTLCWKKTMMCCLSTQQALLAAHWGHQDSVSYSLPRRLLTLHRTYNSRRKRRRGEYTSRISESQPGKLSRPNGLAPKLSGFNRNLKYLTSHLIFSWYGIWQTYRIECQLWWSRHRSAKVPCKNEGNLRNGISKIYLQLTAWALLTTQIT